MTCLARIAFTISLRRASAPRCHCSRSSLNTGINDSMTVSIHWVAWDQNRNRTADRRSGSVTCVRKRSVMKSQVERWPMRYADRSTGSSKPRRARVRAKSWIGGAGWTSIVSRFMTVRKPFQWARVLASSSGRSVGSRNSGTPSTIRSFTTATSRSRVSGFSEARPNSSNHCCSAPLSLSITAHHPHQKPP